MAMAFDGCGTEPYSQRILKNAAGESTGER
jgi:hypothetical protein